MVQWNVEVSPELDRSVRNMLGEGRADDARLAAFVKDAVSREVLQQTLREVWERNKDLSAEDAQALANEAVEWARANRS